MRAFGLVAASFTVFSATVLSAADAQQEITQDRAEAIIQKFAAKEAEFAQARENYIYKQTARVQRSILAAHPRVNGRPFPTSPSIQWTVSAWST
jgi:hypothetical protein